METWFLTHNSHLQDADSFKEKDPQLLHLKNQPLVYQFEILHLFPEGIPGIVTLCGAFGTGKTTFLKTYIARLLDKGITPGLITYFSGENISDYHALQHLLEKQLKNKPEDQLGYLIIDDITSVRDFEKAIIPLKNSGLLEKVLLILCGADSTLTQPDANKAFHFYPLSFRETLLLKNKPDPSQEILYKEFSNYLIHGGNLVAINEFESNNEISDKTFLSYGDWINQEIKKHGRQENFFRDILKLIFKHYNAPVTWNALASESIIDHPKTIGEYFEWLEILDVLIIQFALSETKLIASPKKARKLIFSDPFYFHALYAWLHPEKNIFNQQLKNNLGSSEIISNLVKGSIISECKRYYPTYYIKDEGEIDVAYQKDGRFWPIEVSWLTQLRAKDLKQILKYPNGRILTKTDRSGIIQHIQTEPLPIALWNFEEDIT